MMLRTGRAFRETTETRVTVEVYLDGSGQAQVSLDNGMLRHMLQALATTSLIDIKVDATGDLSHHISEDVALCMGHALNEALSQGPPIYRYGTATVPMDCSLVTVALDLGGRPYWVINFVPQSTEVEGWRTDDISHFLRSLATALRCNLHVAVHYSQNDHHAVEAIFKALGLSLRQAISPDMRRETVASSKGVL
ncbi:MAG: imidazoleglycerol-phosphate dehydratase [Candidatus Thorarchaeota archaeon]